MMAACQEYSQNEQYRDTGDNPGRQRARFPGGIRLRAEKIWGLSAACHQRDSTSAGTRRVVLFPPGVLLTRKLTHAKIFLKLETSKPKMSLREREGNPLTA